MSKRGTLQRRQERSDELMALLDGIATNDARVCRDAERALELTPEQFVEMRGWTNEQLAAANWTRAAFETAWEARKPRSEAAYAVQLAHERTMARIRQQVERGVGAPQVAAIIVPIPTPPPNAEARARAPVITIGGEDK